MTDNQVDQMFDLLTKCINSIQDLKADNVELKSNVAEIKSDIVEIKTDVAELKTDVAELKTDVAELKNDVHDLKKGQQRIEKQMRLNDAAVDSVAGEQMRLKAAITNLEKPNV